MSTLAVIATVRRSWDADAGAYIKAVEVADGQQLEPMVAQAINQFVLGCKADGIWSAIKASCVMMGARTLSGALTPLVGTAPTNYNFVSGDYARKTGLKGDGTSKYLDSGRNNLAEAQNSKHISCYVTAPPTITSGISRTYISTLGVNSGASWLHGASSTNLLSVRANTGTSIFDLPNSASITGFVGVSRSDSTTTAYRYSGATTSSTAATSTMPYNSNLYVFFGVGGNPPATCSDARMTFYSVGDNLTLATLDTRVSNLYTQIGLALT